MNRRAFLGKLTGLGASAIVSPKYADAALPKAKVTRVRIYRPQDFNPTRLFRGAGFGGSVVTPLGPLGIDLGYGFDRVDAQGRKAPKWQMHFKLGQLY